MTRDDYTLTMPTDLQSLSTDRLQQYKQMISEETLPIRRINNCQTGTLNPLAVLEDYNRALRNFARMDHPLMM